MRALDIIESLLPKDGTAHIERVEAEQRDSKGGVMAEGEYLLTSVKLLSPDLRRVLEPEHLKEDGTGGEHYYYRIEI